MKSDEFLQMFRDVEELLALQYPPEQRRYNSAVMEYINDSTNTKYREELNTCREIRNLLTHHADIGGQAIAEPSDQVMAVLKKILKYLGDPPVVSELATPFENLLTTSPGQRTLDIILKMKESGFSHVPVLDHGKFCGVFSVSVPFSFMLEKNSPISPDFVIGDFGEYLKIENHSTERFLFAPANMTVKQAAKEFEIVGSNQKRLAMILITANGRANEKIIGVITPFDIIKSRENG